MMTTIHKRDARTRALPAIAAALALSSTPVLAQQQAPPAQTATAMAAQPAQPAKPPPIVDLGDAKPAATPAVAPAKPLSAWLNDPRVQMGGGALILLIIIAATASILIGRRRLRREKEWADQETLSHEVFETALEPAATAEPVVHEEQPAIVAPAASAFAWSNEPQAQAHGPEGDLQADRHPGETWTERAHRGPSPENPSASLKTRLKRAAFFDKREMEAAAGMAAPVDPDAGLPEAVVDEQEHESA